MNIILDHLMPDPLSSMKHQENSIWGTFVEINQGEKIMLNASSGKGKSTFTLTVSGLRKDYSGTVKYNDVDIQCLSNEQWTDIRQKKLSVVFQDLQLFPHLTVGENLQIKNQLHPVFRDDELKNMLKRVDIESKWNQQCNLLSMGQQQRVAIIRAMCQPFEMLIMDEPFSHLDDQNTQLCLQMINERCDELGAGFVLTSLGNDHLFNFDKILYL